MQRNRKRMLITGVSGLLGNNLAYYFREKYDILGLYFSHLVNIEGIQTQRADLLSEVSFKYIVREFDPDVMIHCASLTNVDFCEMNKELTERVNISGAKVVVESIKENHRKLVYISSDSVYDGYKGDFQESDPISPQNYYGLTKYEGELEVLKKENSLVLRTNIFGWNIQNKKSLGEWVLHELEANRRINGFKDAYFSSIYTMELARIIDIALKKNLTGVYNSGALDSCSKYEFCLRIADCFGLDKTLITPISVDDFDFKARRGKRLTLNVDKLQKALDYELPTIDYSMNAFYRDYKCGLPEEIRKSQVEPQRESVFIPYGKQSIEADDIRAVVNVLSAERVTQGPKVEEFESALAEYCNAKYTVAVNSGTSALHIACLAAGIEEGDEVITSPITFVASANCAVYCGATPIFGDIDRWTYNISSEGIETRITERTKAVIPVHFAGQSCDMEVIQQIVKAAEKKYGNKIYIIEDACHALGSLYRAKKVGSCAYSDMAVMSFHPVKHITTGEGGAVLSNDESLDRKLRLLRSHGITNRTFELVASNSKDPWYYEQVDLGYNYRITDIQCALGLSQLRKLPRIIARRREIVDKYNASFVGLQFIQTPFEAAECRSNFHLYVLLFNFEKMGKGRAQIMTELNDKGIKTQVHYIPVHTQPYFKKRFGTNWGNCPNAEQYYQRCLSIPLYPTMSDHDMELVIEAIVCLANK